jgi:hypothetical protein
MVSLAIPTFTKSLGRNLAEPTVCVSEPPYFVRRPAPVRMAVVGNDVLLECETGGDPVPRTRWTRQGAPDIDQTRAKVWHLKLTLLLVFSELNLLISTLY